MKRTCKYTRLSRSTYLYNTNFKRYNLISSSLKINVPYKTRKNGTLFLHVLLSPKSSIERSFDELKDVRRIFLK